MTKVSTKKAPKAGGGRGVGAAWSMVPGASCMASGARSAIPAAARVAAVGALGRMATPVSSVWRPPMETINAKTSPQGHDIGQR